MPPEVVEKLVKAIKGRNAAALAELFADDAVLHHPLVPEPIRGSEAISARANGRLSTRSPKSTSPSFALSTREATSPSRSTR